MRNHTALLTIAIVMYAPVALAQSAAAQKTPPAKALDSPPAAAIAAPADRTPPSQAALVATNSPQSGAVRMLKTRDVITDDDLQAMRSGVAIDYLWSEAKVPASVNPVLCDRACEAEARAAAGMSRSPNSEWQAQFAAARIDLAADKEWRVAYLDGLSKAHQYCVFRGQSNTALAAPASDTTGQQYV
ncbi:MAG: hypothetical protein KGL02_13595, partial [Acidobacteriota bacterium]|nr:hypothetical protein [Acidobacteriota bacterium]